MRKLSADFVEKFPSRGGPLGGSLAVSFVALTSLLGLASMVLAGAQSGFTTLTLSSGSQIETYLHVSEDQSAPWRVLLAFPPGAQNRAMVNAGLQNWLRQLISSGWTVISPVATDGQLFGGDRLQVVPELLDAVRDEHDLNFEKVFLFGISNGGISALETASRYSETFHSVTVAPGLLRSSSRLSQLSTLPVNVIVGERDGRWTEAGTELVRQLKALEGDANLTVIPGAGHGAFHEVSYRQFQTLLTRATGLR